MIDRTQMFLAKAQESLEGAEHELALGRFNNSANRAYYACFQGGIAAMVHARVFQSSGDDSWSHSFVAAQFDGMLINRRKLYGADLWNVIGRNHLVRLRADYEEDPVSQTEASRAVRRAQILLAAIQAVVRRDQ